MTNAPPTDRGPDPVELAQRLDAPRSGSDAAAPLHPDAAACGHFNIRIARDGTWFYHGSPITRKPLVKLFAGVLRRDDAGRYLLVTPAERGFIDVDDAPFTAVQLTVTGSGRAQRLHFRTNLDDEVVAGPLHPIRVAEDRETRTPSPYIRIRDELEALITRAVFYQLVDLGVTETMDGVEVFGVWSEQQFFALGRLS
jgi:uncharacterized protein